MIVKCDFWTKKTPFENGITKLLCSQLLSPKIFLELHLDKDPEIQDMDPSLWNGCLAKVHLTTSITRDVEIERLRNEALPL